MTEIEIFVEDMKQKYGESVVSEVSTCSKEILDKIPEPLKEFYSCYNSVEFPFGRIDTLPVAIRHSGLAEPFKSENWFCFGSDGYFSFWVSSYKADETGLWIASWDHDVDDKIEANYSTLLGLLKDMEKEYEEFSTISDE